MPFVLPSSKKTCLVEKFFWYLKRSSSLPWSVLLGMDAWMRCENETNAMAQMPRIDGARLSAHGELVFFSIYREWWADDISHSGAHSPTHPSVPCISFFCGALLPTLIPFLSCAFLFRWWWKILPIDILKHDDNSLSSDFWTLCSNLRCRCILSFFWSSVDLHSFTCCKTAAFFFGFSVLSCCRISTFFSVPQFIRTSKLIIVSWNLKC